MSGDARSRKSDQVASKMGEMLLKGYKMLAVSCDVCSNVLMQDRQGNNICVSCVSDEPALAAKVDMVPKVSVNLGSTGGNSKSESDLRDAITTLYDEIATTSQQLCGTDDLNRKEQLVSYMGKCAETIKLLRTTNQ